MFVFVLNVLAGQIVCPVFFFFFFTFSSEGVGLHLATFPLDRPTSQMSFTGCLRRMSVCEGCEPGRAGDLEAGVAAQRRDGMPPSCRCTNVHGSDLCNESVHIREEHS